MNDSPVARDVEKPEISEDAKGIALVCLKNEWWTKSKIAFPGIKSDRELLIKRLAYWIEHMEGDIKFEAPLTAYYIRREAVMYFDWVIQESENRKLALAQEG